MDQSKFTGFAPVIDGNYMNKFWLLPVSGAGKKTGTENP